MYGDGEQSHSFCFVSDLIEGVVRLMNSPAAITGPISLGKRAEFTMRQLAEHVLAKTGSKSVIEFEPLPLTTRANASLTSARRGRCSGGNRKCL